MCISPPPPKPRPVRRFSPEHTKHCHRCCPPFTDDPRLVTLVTVNSEQQAFTTAVSSDRHRSLSRATVTRERDDAVFSCGPRCTGGGGRTFSLSLCSLSFFILASLSPRTMFRAYSSACRQMDETILRMCLPLASPWILAAANSCPCSTMATFETTAVIKSLRRGRTLRCEKGIGLVSNQDVYSPFGNHTYLIAFSMFRA